MSEEAQRIIRDQADRIKASGVLGRSRSYQRLFDYLVENTLSGRAPKEIEIAADVFSRDKSFDPAQDSMVRVYAHNLRGKIRQFYESDGSAETQRLYIPRGEYRLAITEEQLEAEEDVRQGAPARAQIVAALSATLLVGLALGYFLGSDNSPSRAEPTVLWQALADDDLPIQVVVGDYYIFAEMDDDGDVARFVREFAVNSRNDLESFATRTGARQGRYRDLDLTYLAHSSAPALGDVLSVLHSIGKPVDVVPMSQFDPAAVRTSHIVYVGYFSSLDKLFDFAFAASDLAIGATYDELLNIESGDVYASSAGLPVDYRNYRDYGYFSTFPGPGGNQLVIVAGTRDEGVMHIAQVASDPAFVDGTVSAVPAGSEHAFELLYEVTGFDRTHIDSMLVHSASLDDSQIWHGAELRSGLPD
jgi:hypothetical protein